MKKAPIHIFLMTFLYLSVAHISTAQTKLGISSGINYSTVYIENDITNNNESLYTMGLRFGISVDIPLKGVFYLQPSVSFSQKGFKQEENWFSGNDNEFEANASYIDVPIHVLYKSNLGPGDLIVGAGPYVAYGIGGKWKTERRISFGGIKNGDLIFDDEGSNYQPGEYLYGRPLDYGGNVLAGYDLWGALSLQFMAQIGVNLQPEWNVQPQRSVFKNRN